MSLERSAVAGVGKADLTRLRIEHPVEACGEHALGYVLAQEIVCPREHLAGGRRGRGYGSHDGARRGHRQRRGNAFATDVSDDQSEPPVGEWHDVIEITPHR